MSRNKLFLVTSFAILICVSFGFFALSGDDQTTAVSFSSFTPVEQTPAGDYLGTWTAGAPIPSPGSNGGAGVGYTNATNDTCWLYSVNGDIDGSGTAPGQFRRYNIITNTWQALPNYTGRAWTSAGRIGTNIYVVGGLPSGASAWSAMTGTLQRYSIATNLWTTLTSAPTPCGSSGVSGYQDSLLYAIGGQGTTGNPINNVQLYNQTSGTWRAATPLPIARANGWMVIKGDTIYYGCGVGPTTATFNNNIYVGVISQSDRATIAWSVSGVTYPGTNRHRMDACLFGCFGIYVGPGATATWWGTGNDSYTWQGGNSAFVNVGPIPSLTSDAHVGAGYFQRGSYRVWKAVVATGLIMSPPYHILNTQIYTDSCLFAPPLSEWCEGFTSVTFPPTGWALTGTATLLWLRATVSAYGNGVGSAKADFYNVSSGTRQLNSQTFTAWGVSQLRFADAYCTYINENDQLQIQASTNGGTTWTPVVTLNGGISGELVTAPPQTAAFTPTANQWKWQTITLPPNTNKVQFNAITAYGNNLYIDSICVKDITGGITPITLTPNEYSLNQNYPNPFNPTTTITYNMPKAGIVKIAVYDILGREVATLVNGHITVGTHDVVFDAANLSSGVYFYKLVTGDINITKKMLLVK